MSNPLVRTLISGGGIGGLAAALALARTGAEVTVFEKRKDPIEEGAGIQIGPNGTRILSQLGVANKLRPLVSSPEFLRIHDGPSGEQQTQLPLGRWLETRHSSPYWVAHRSDLHACLLATAEASPLIAINRGVEIDAVKPYPDEVLALSNGEIVGAGDLLVAADGLHSAIRSCLFSAHAPRYSGKSAARTVLPIASVPEGIARQDIGIWLAPAGHVVHYPVRGGEELAVVVIRKESNGDTDWATAVQPSWATEAVLEFVDPVRNLVAASKIWRKWALAELAPLKTWFANRTVLLGDAAHPVLPFLAQGAVLALEDAATLAKCLSDANQNAAADAISEDELEIALNMYQDVRRTRASRVQSASRRNGKIYHLDGPMRAARNMTLRCTPPTSLLARYDWLYGWKLGD